MLANDNVFSLKGNLFFSNAWVPFGEEDNSAIYVRFDFSWAFIRFLGRLAVMTIYSWLGVNVCFGHFLFCLTWLGTISHGNL